MMFDEIMDDGKCIGMKLINDQVVKREHIVVVNLPEAILIELFIYFLFEFLS